MDKLPKKTHVSQTVAYLNYAFAEALKRAAPTIGTKNVEGTELYRHQVDYCYMINEIERGPGYIVPKMISKVNDLIDELNQKGDPPQTTESTSW